MSKTKFSELPTKVTPVLDDLVTGLDSEDSNPTTENKNFTIEKIWDTIFPDKTTNDLVEGDNLYYTETRVTNNQTVVDLWANKADKSNVLELDNITPFTPSSAYEPATKDYVDNFSLPDATEVIKGKARLATSSEVMVRTDNTTIVTPSKLGYESITSSDTIQASANTERTNASWNWVKVKEFEIWAYRLWGSCRLKWEAKWTDVSWNIHWLVAIRKNGTVISAISPTTTWYLPYQWDVNCVEWDLIQIYISSESVNSAERPAFVRNVDLCYTEIQSSLIPTINLD